MRVTYRLPESIDDDLERFGQEVERLRRGEISAAEFRAFRVPQGVYEQREEGLHMLRVRLPAGGLLPEQLSALARVSRRFGSGVLHVTTRQDIQIHEVPLEALHPALLELRASGLSTKGGGGNTVRNIVACPRAGVCRLEEFDVSPVAISLTEHFLPDPANYRLPRKYKIAFSGCGDDCASATLSDVGFIARERNGRPGFGVWVGGGLGTQSRVADPLEEFVPVEEAWRVAEAVKRVFDQHGNRKNKNRARLRFLLRKIGMDRFRELYEAELAALEKEPIAAPVPRPIPAGRAPAAERPSEDSRCEPAAGFEAWRRAHVEAQKQEGKWIVHVPLRLGDLEVDVAERLAEVTARTGDGTLRSTQTQNLAFRDVGEEELPALHRDLAALGLTELSSPEARELVVCAGAATCKLGICLSRGLASEIYDLLERRSKSAESRSDNGGGGGGGGGDGDEAAAGLQIHLSGCPNSCGRHAAADLGLYGGARRAGGRLMPSYTVLAGGKVRAGETRLATGRSVVPARAVPAFLAELLAARDAAAPDTDFGAWLEAGGREEIDRIAARHALAPEGGPDPSYFRDWGSEEEFSLAGRGPGECSAGVFDLIEVDLQSARDALEAARPLEATTLAARALLVTRGQEARTDRQALDLFNHWFLDDGLVSDSFRPLIARARRATEAQRPAEAFGPESSEAADLVRAVKDLYDSMDASLRFRPSTLAAATTSGKDASPSAPASPPVAGEAGAAPVTAEPTEGETASPPHEAAATPDREVDLRGVTCPLNWVRAKMLLSSMKSGEVLALQLDDQGARNVPESAEKEGHEVLRIEREGDAWSVWLRRG